MREFLLAAGNPLQNLNLQGLAGSFTSLTTLVPLIVSVGGLYMLSKRNRSSTVILSALCGLILAGTALGAPITSTLSQVSHGFL